MQKENKKDSKGLGLYSALGWVVGVNILKLFYPYIHLQLWYVILYYFSFIYVLYRSIRYMIKYKKYKEPIIIIVSAILIYLIVSVIRVLF